MPKKGRKFLIYGAFGSKSRARKAERRLKGAWIVERRIRGRRRYVILRRKGS